MTLTRRTLIKNGALTLAAASAGGSVFEAPTVAAIVYDSRSPASVAFAAGYHGRMVDIAAEDPKFWQSLRSMATHGAIVGMTGWNDFVIARGFLQERGMRITHEVREQGFCRWSMS